MATIQYHQTLVKNLLQHCNGKQLDKPAELIETHISSVILSGEFAYKIKKPVNFGFLDFTQLNDRKRFCEEEVRLNSRLAPEIYIATVAITGSMQNPEFEGKGQIIDYAVKMRRFNQSSMLDRLLEQGKMEPDTIDSLADRIAGFHQSIEVASSDSSFASATLVLQPMLQNFEQILATLSRIDDRKGLQQLLQWTTNQFEQLKSLLEIRRQEGFIRECHGDMHLGNMFLSDDKVIIFDGIEFNEALRWIDVMSEVAFITMDLNARGADFYAQRLLNRYLEISGDYDGLKLLRFYQVYRAMVRAKVARLNLQQVNPGDHKRAQLESQYQNYIQLALKFTLTSAPSIFLMYGFSASGKSTVSSQLLERLGAIRIRSDRERKRLFGNSDSNKEELNAGIYNPELTDKTYQHLLVLSESIVSSGFSVIVDATFLKASQRSPFQQLATRLEIPFRVLQLKASLQSLHRRLQERNQHAGNISDATEDVIRQQLSLEEPLVEHEPRTVIDTDKPIDYERLAKTLLFNPE